MKTCVQPLKAILLACLLFLCTSAWATHIHGGYITYKWLQRNDYEITVGVFYDSGGGMPAPSLVRVSILGVQKQELDVPITSVVYNMLKGSPNSIALYKIQHTFPEVSLFGGVRYKLGTRIENRNIGIVNLANPSDHISFYIETELYVNSFIGFNSSSVPTDTLFKVTGKVNEPLIASFTSGDSDDDSLIYTLAAPLQSDLKIAEGYRSPEQVQPCEGCTFLLNSQTGQLTWNKPVLQGAYAIAVRVEEWRKIPGTSRRIRVGYTIRDIQLHITD